MGRKLTCFCDVCLAETAQEKLRTVIVPVMVRQVDEHGYAMRDVLSPRNLEVCDDCMGRLAILETTEGMVCSVPDEGVYKWRESGSDAK